MPDYQSVTSDVRDALTTVLAPTGVTVLPWPGDTQALHTPCWCIGIPDHDPATRIISDSYCRDPWLLTWPVTLYVIQTNDRASTDTIDQQTGLLIELVRSAGRLGGLLAEDAEVTGVRARLGREDRDPRLHEVTAVIQTIVDQARP